MTNFYQLFFGGHYNSFIQFLFEAKTMNAADFYEKYQHCLKNQVSFDEPCRRGSLDGVSAIIKDDYALFVCFAKSIGFLSELPTEHSCDTDSPYARLIRTKLSSVDLETFNAHHLEAIDGDTFTCDRQILSQLGYKVLFLSEGNNHHMPCENKPYIFITRTENVALFKALNLPSFTINEHILYSQPLRLYHRRATINTPRIVKLVYTLQEGYRRNEL